MNSRKFSEAMNQLDGRYVSEALSYHRNRKFSKPGKIAVLAAAILILLALCSFAAYEMSLRGWTNIPTTDPVKAVQSALENLAREEYTLVFRIDEIEIDEAETERVRAW